MVSDAGARDAEALEGNDLFRVLYRTGVDGNIFAGLDTRHPGLTDGRVRQALGSAIDRDHILEEVFRGRGRTTSLPWPTYSPAFDEVANEHYTRDIDRARQLLAEAGGVETIPEIPVSYTAGSGSEPNIAQYTPSTLSVSAFPFNSAKNASNFLDDDYATDAWTVADADSPGASTIYRRLNNDLLEDAFILELVAPDSPLVTTSALHGVTWSKRSERDLAHAYHTE